MNLCLVLMKILCCPHNSVCHCSQSDVNTTTNALCVIPPLHSNHWIFVGQIFLTVSSNHNYTL